MPNQQQRSRQEIFPLDEPGHPSKYSDQDQTLQRSYYFVVHNRAYRSLRSPQDLSVKIDSPINQTSSGPGNSLSQPISGRDLQDTGDRRVGHFSSWWPTSARSSRTRRLLKVLAPWQSGEMQVQNGCQTAARPTQGPQIAVADRNSTTGHHSTIIVPTPATNLGSPSLSQQNEAITWQRLLDCQNSSRIVLAPNCPNRLTVIGDQIPVGARDVMAEKRFWQALIIPLVVGCMIFLTAVWTRQVIFAVRNDTIMMIVILGTVFLSMSAMAFWLAQDTHLDQDEQRSVLPSIDERAFGINHLRSCPRYRAQQSQSQSNRNRHHSYQNQQRQVDFSLSHWNGSGPLRIQPDTSKSCSIAVLDCQPPDYQSAMLNSFPVSLLYQPTVANHDDKSKNALDVVNNLGTDQNSSSSGTDYNHIGNSVSTTPTPPLTICETQRNINNNSQPQTSATDLSQTDLDQSQQYNLPPSYEDSTKSRPR